MLELLSKYYVRDLARKVRRGMEGNALKAKDNGYRIYGYSTDPGTRRYVVDEAEASVVREVFSRRVSGESMNSIAGAMAERGHVTSTGRPVDFNWVKRILTRRAYTGLYSWGGIEVEGGMPRIVDDRTFEMAQKVSPRRTRKQDGWEPYRLTGKLFCGVCGLPMHGYAGRGRNGHRYRYYGCKEDGGCGRRGTRADLVEDSIASSVLDACSDERKMRMVAKRIVEAYAEPGEGQAELDAVEQQIATLEREQRNLTKAVMKGFVNDEMVSRNEKIKHRLKNLHNRHGVLASQVCEITEDDIVGYMMHGFDRTDEDFIFGSVVNRAYLFEDCVLLVFSFRNEDGDLAEVRAALDAQIAKNPNRSGFGSRFHGVGGGT